MKGGILNQATTDDFFLHIHETVASVPRWLVSYQCAHIFMYPDMCFSLVHT